MSKKKQISVTPSNIPESNIAGETKVNRIKKHRMISIISVSTVIVITIIVLSVGMAFSWFAPKQMANLSTIVTSFKTQTEYSISASDYAELTDDVDFDVSTLRTLKLRLKYNGPSSAYIRVQLFEQFEKDGTMYPAKNVEYTLSPDWVKNGDYYYYKNIATYETKYGQKVETEIPFVNGATTSINASNSDGVVMNLVTVVEAVQPDRFEEFFGMDPETLFAEN